jgi:hypothetical protein
MTSPADYTTEEWEVLSNAFIYAGMGVSKADKNFPSEEYLEYEMFVNATMVVAQQHMDNELIQAVMQDKKTGDNPENKRLIEGSISLPDVIVHMQHTAEILAAKAPAEEAAEFKQWLIEVAGAVARASGDRLFGGGEPVNPDELETMAHIRTALGLGEMPAN